MLKNLVTFALHQPLFLILITILFIGAGVYSFETLPIEAFPDVTDTQVAIITLFPGHAPEEVEKQITIPLEIALSGMPHAIRMFSHTQFGLSFIYITFDDGADHYFARQQTLERLQAADLPDGIKPQLGPLSSPVGEIYRTYLKSSIYDATELRSIQDWVVTRHMKIIPGIADVVSRGGFVKQYQVVPDLTRMKSLGISMKQLFDSIEHGNANAGGGFIEKGEQQWIIRGVGLLGSADDIRRVVISQRNGVPVLVRDLADVNSGFIPRQGMVNMDDIEDIVGGTILMRKGENPSNVLNAVREKMKELNETILPKGVELVPYYDRTILIDNTLRTVFTNLAEGAVLVAVVLYLFLGNLRSAAIVALMIPMALLATFLGLKLRGIPANLLSLGAMDFGIIVDGAVIVVENIFRSLSEHRPKDRNSFRSVIQEAAIQVGRPTFFSMLIIIIAHLPIFSLQRHEGRIFAPMAYTVTSALIGSLLFSLTLVPLLCFFLLRKGLPEEDNLLLRTCKRVYKPLLLFVLRHRVAVIAVSVVALAGSVLLVPKLGSEFLPELNEGSIWVNFTLPPGISNAEVASTMRKSRKALHELPEVTTVVSQAGRPEDGTDPKPINMVEMLVDIKQPKDWRPGATKESLIEEMEKRLDALPGVEPTFTQPIRDQVLESISQIDGQIVVKVFGEDPKILREKIQEVLGQIRNVPGVARAFVDRAGVLPQLQIEIDRERAARYGINVSDIDDLIETALGGKPATYVWEGERRFGVVVRLKEDERRSLESLNNILIDTADKQHVPLNQVAKISFSEGSLNISRESGLRVSSIGVFIRGRDMGSIVQEMQEKVAAKVQFPKGYTVQWGGEFENQQRAMKTLAVIVPVSVLMIFVLLFEAFHSVKSAALILLNVPFAIIGGILALYLTGIHLSVSAAIGFIALFGQAVLNGVVMVSYINELRQKGLAQFDAVVEGALVRLRTVLMTSLLAMLGLLPMALSKGVGSEVQKPLATVIIGGLVSASILTLLVLPALYLIFERPGKTNGESEETVPA